MYCETLFESPVAELGYKKNKKDEYFFASVRTDKAKMNFSNLQIKE